MAHLGPRAFEEIGGEVVQTTSFVLSNQHINRYKGTYCRLIEPTTQQGKEEMFLAGEKHYSATQDNFAKIPGSPVAYWVSKNYFDVCANECTIASLASPRTGMTTGDNDRFLRHWFEILFEKCCFSATSAEDAMQSHAKWFPYLKGGEFRRWYGNKDYLVNWENDGYEIKNNIKPNGLKAASVRSEGLYFKPLISWSAVSSGTFSCRLCENGALFDSGGSSVFISQHRYYILSLLNSKVAQYALNIANPTLNYQPGDVGSIPVRFDDDDAVNEMARENIAISRTDWDSFETSWDFKRHPLVRPVPIIAQAFQQWGEECSDRFNRLKANEEEINRIFINIYGLQDDLSPEEDDKDVTVRKADLSRDIRSFISFAVGCMFGRYSLDEPGLAYAGGEWDAAKYHKFLPDEDNCIPITDEDYFNDDIVGRLVEFVRTVYGSDTLEENLSFIANALGNKGNTSREVIRNYFLNDFIKDHNKTYQKRPIYWLYDSGKQNGFKALIYMHRYSEDTTGRIRADYLFKMQRAYENELKRIQDIIDGSSNSREVAQAEKRKEKLKKQLKETRDYDQKIAHLALARIPIELDDGVKANYEKVQTGKDGKIIQILARI